MKAKISTLVIYLAAAAATSAYMFPRDIQNVRALIVPLIWLSIFAVPLLFVFAYPRLLFEDSTEKVPLTVAVVLNLLGLATVLFFFPRLASPFPDNLARDSYSWGLLLVPLVAMPVFLVAGLSILLKKRSSLAPIAFVLVWPYLFILGLGTLARHLPSSWPITEYYFLSFLAPALFAFAAGAVSYRANLSHAMAILAGLAAAPWIYWMELRDPEISNAWIMLNVPDRAIFYYDVLHAKLTILAVSAIVLATTTAACRLLPSRWQFRNSRVSGRTWPAFAASFLFLALWFSRSVMPYRIPGAVDGGIGPILRILHIEKHGLQFHETSISVVRDARFIESENNRRLFQYRFGDKYGSGVLPQVLMQRVQDAIRSPGFGMSASTPIKPLRAWNADAWYVDVPGSGIYSANTEDGTAPSPEIVVLFHDLQATPLTWEAKSDAKDDVKDVCLGFCYDPLSGLGFLYANHRCFNSGQGFNCR